MNSKSKRLLISQEPLWHSGVTLPKMMGNHIIALVPAIIFSIVIYHLNAARVLALSIVFAVIFEIIFRRLLHTKGSIFDLHSIYISILLALLLPPSTPWWLVIMGVLVMVGLGKMIFGGYGSYPLNPVLVGFAIMQLSWSKIVDYTSSQQFFKTGFISIDPLSVSKSAGTAGSHLYNLWDLFIGKQAGGLGSSAGLFILIGGLYLIIRGYITWHKPVSFLVGILVTGELFHLLNSQAYPSPFFHLFAGMTFFAAFFLVTDTSSTPVNPIPMLIFGFFAGAFTILIRSLGSNLHGAVYAILLMNIANPFLDEIYSKPAYLKGNLNV